MCFYLLLRAFTSFALDVEGRLIGWGRNDVFQLGIGHKEQMNDPVFVGLEDIERVFCGQSHFFALNKDGELFGWGDNRYGQLGIGDKQNQSFPVQVPIENVKDISCGNWFTIVLQHDGTILSFGNNKLYGLGLGNREDFDKYHRIYYLTEYRPQVVPLEEVIQIDTGYMHAIALTKNREVYSWGYGEQGQLGYGLSINQSIPRKVDSIENIILIFCTSENSYALSHDGVLFGWGNNSYGQLGNVKSTNIPISLIELPSSIFLPDLNIPVQSYYKAVQDIFAEMNGTDLELLFKVLFL